MGWLYLGCLGSDKLPIGVAKLPLRVDVVWVVSSVTQSIGRVTYLHYAIHHSLPHVSEGPQTLALGTMFSTVIKTTLD